MIKQGLVSAAAGLALLGGVAQAQDQSVVVNVKRLTLEMAQQAATAVIEQCRKEGVQVAVTVVDRAGHVQTVLRDVLAMDLTLEISRQKAYTAMSFNSPTSDLESRFTAPFSIAKVQGVLPAAGGVPIAAGGTILGGIGVSGAPSGETDEKCARAGMEAIEADLEMGMM